MARNNNKATGGMYHAQGERKWLSNVGYIFACIDGQKSETQSPDRWLLCSSNISALESVITFTVKYLLKVIFFLEVIDE